MTHGITNQTITRALVQNPRYLADFGRVEADVVLQMSDGGTPETNVKVITSVPAHEGEGFESLYVRLTQDAARLWRMLEARNFPKPTYEESHLAA